MIIEIFKKLMYHNDSFLIIMWFVYGSITLFKAIWGDDIYTIQQLFGQILLILVLGITAIYYKIDDLIKQLAKFKT